MTGYDIGLIEKTRPVIKTPMTIMGGAVDVSYLQEMIKKYGIMGYAAGSMFVFKGKYRAVLINYPNRDDKMTILGNIL